MNINEILIYFTNKKGRFNTRLIKKVENEKCQVYNNVLLLTSFMNSDRTLSERLYALRFNLSYEPTCKVCDVKITSLNDDKTNFRETCSKKCANILKTGKKLNYSNDKKIIANEKRKQSMMEKYGVEYNSQRHDVKPLLNKDRNTKYYYNEKYPHINFNLLNKESLYDLYHIQNKNIFEITKLLGCSVSVTHEHLVKNDIITPTPKTETLIEKITKDILDKNDIYYVQNDRKALKGKEIDFYIPQHNLGIECHGLYWHNENFKDVNYHKNKSDVAIENNILLLQFFENEFYEKRENIESIILSKCKLTKKIYARKCIIEDIDFNTYKVFVEKNHIQGFSSAKIYKGLVYENELVAVMSFGKPRFNGYECDYELIRYCNKIGYTVIGGFSKLLKTMDEYTILSYANRRWSDGNVYIKNGFKFLKSTKPGFFYHKGEYIKSRYSDMRPLKVLHDEGWLRVYDCGNLVFVKDKKRT